MLINQEWECREATFRVESEAPFFLRLNKRVHGQPAPTIRISL